MMIDAIVVAANAVVFFAVVYLVMVPQARIDLIRAETRWRAERPIITAVILLLAIACAGGVAAASFAQHYTPFW